MSKEIKVGIIGFGTVGAGVAENLLVNQEVISTRTGLSIKLHKIADLDITTDRGIQIPAGVLTQDVNELINECDIVVELVGGTGIAKKFILQALAAKKPVVSANKALLALHGEELFKCAAENGVDIYFEASVAGGIPIIKALREGLVSNRIEKIYGIMNGTCNYILTRMEREKAAFNSVLEDAQKLGYAEAEPSLDIDGFDTAHKASILASLAYGTWFGLGPVSVGGIRTITLDDLEYADELGYRIKLLSVIKSVKGKVQISVRPTMIPKTALLANISDVFNGVMVEGDTVGQTLFYGRGAGRKATASAVVSDIVDVAHNINCDCQRRLPAFPSGELFNSVSLPEEIKSRFYLRLTVKDCPGVIASVSQILANKLINISSIMQHENLDAGIIPLVVLTGIATEKDLREAVREIENLAVSTDKVQVLHIEDI